MLFAFAFHSSLLIDFSFIKKMKGLYWILKIEFDLFYDLLFSNFSKYSAIKELQHAKLSMYQLLTIVRRCDISVAETKIFQQQSYISTYNCLILNI